MNITRTSNPIFGDRVFANEASHSTSLGQTMTIKGAINKTLILFSFLLLGAIVSWKMTAAGNTAALGLAIPASIGALVLALITSFFKKAAPITAPLYSVCEGFLLGSISALFNMAYSGIVFQAITLTLLVFGLMLFLYKTGILRASSKFTKGVFAATMAIGIFYLVSFIAGFFTTGISDYLFEHPLLGIVISVIIVVVAALNLVLDFSFIEDSANSGAPKYMEWYAGFGLMVTLVWLYVEILRLLSYLRD
ncbi:MAG: Bax inhibitor-1/YccA family protein [Bacteroidales bacterium]|nr:Bax inhibitor-1/YccA family protein [Bacteroidales bacterium]